MEQEKTIYQGHPSISTIAGSLALAGVLFVAVVVGLVLAWSTLGSMGRTIVALLLLIPIGIVAVKWLGLRFLHYEVTTERIKVTKGILSRRTDELELYRVKDIALIEPFLLRMFGDANILVITNDAGHPQLELKGIHGARDVREQLRHSVEECRVRKGARVMEME